jgi:hydrogenase maturation factor
LLDGHTYAIVAWSSSGTGTCVIAVQADAVEKTFDSLATYGTWSTQANAIGVAIVDELASIYGEVASYTPPAVTVIGPPLSTQVI